MLIDSPLNLFHFRRILNGVSRITALRRLYSRRQAITMAIALALGIGALLHASSLLAVQDPPPVADEPVVSIVLGPGKRLSWAHVSTYEARETISGCRNPATVEVDALVNGQWSGNSTITHGFVHGEVFDPGDKVHHLKVLLAKSLFPPQTWRAARQVVSGRRGNDDRFGVKVNLWYPSRLIVGMASASTVRAVIARVRFTADWVTPRSSGTCFVRFPTLQAPKLDPILNPPDLVVTQPPAGPGYVDVVSTGGEIVNGQASIPPPSDPRIPRWSCASTAVSITQENNPTGGSANCGGFAVFTEPGADEHVALWLLIDGALIGVAAALFVESAVRFRWPMKDQTEPSG